MNNTIIIFSLDFLHTQVYQFISVCSNLCTRINNFTLRSYHKLDKHNEIKQRKRIVLTLRQSFCSKYAIVPATYRQKCT